MRAIICGGRDYWLTDEDLAYLDGLGLVEVVVGGASGADQDGAEWAREKGIPVRVFHAWWHDEGRAAGPKRNQRMADYLVNKRGAVAVIAFPGGKGTADMRRKATGMGIEVMEPHAKQTRLL